LVARILREEPHRERLLKSPWATGTVTVSDRSVVDVVKQASPEDFLGAREERPTVAAVLEAVEAAVA
jgi:hypothetical protein